MRVISAVRFNVRALWVRTFAAMVVTGMSVTVLLANGNVCCGPEPGTNPCHAAGCADTAGNSTCLGVVLSQIGQCCGVGDGTASCVRVREGQPGTAWCVRCNGGGQCGTCSTLPAEPPPNCDPTGWNQMNCNADGGTWENCTCNYSPILVKLGNGRYRLTGTDDGVWFDVNGDGNMERTAWTDASVEQAFLVLDRNGNGTIDSAAEMFGNLTPLRSGEKAPNGFEALKDLVAGSGNHDDVLDAQDPAYRTLRLWTDENHNGVSEPNELQRLREAGVEAIELTYRRVQRRDENGNLLAFEGTVHLRQRGHTVPRRIYDVYFVLDPST